MTEPTTTNPDFWDHDGFQPVPRSPEIQTISEAVNDLSQRLLDKATLLASMAEQETSMAEHHRLRGKAEGLRLAHSYLYDTYLLTPTQPSTKVAL